MHIVIVACLFLHYTAALTIFGAATFRLLTPWAGGIDDRLARISKILFGVLIVSAVAMVMTATAAMGGGWSNAVDPQVVGEVLLQTGFGKAWQWHLGLAVILGLAIWIGSPARPWTAVAATLLLASLAFVGHAAMVEGVPGDLRRLNQAVHLLSAGAWLGGLVPLVLVLVTSRSAPASALPALLRFSAYGTAAVVLVLITGAINTLALVGTLRGVSASPYAWALLVKLALVAAMIGFALRNRFQLMPHVTTDSTRIIRRLRRSVSFEIALGLAIILVASVLGTLAPPIG